MRAHRRVLDLHARPGELLSRGTEEVLAEIRRVLDEKGYPPSLRDLAEALGVSGTTAVDYHLARLRAKGWIERVPAISRGLRLNDLVEGSQGQSSGSPVVLVGPHRQPAHRADRRPGARRERPRPRIADLRARLFGLRSEHALLGKEPNPGLAVTYADRERRFMHETRQIAKQVIADELEELRAYVLEGTELEERATALPERG